ncbi:MAG: DUF721 domain-containing protein [Rhodobacteraceae bacterium]|nr:DUF721 domain-containing protein [Paracoccaceae bacterium]
MHEPTDPPNGSESAAPVSAAAAASGGGAQRRGRGFRAAGGLLRGPIRKASESRGFAVARVLTHWAEIAGAATARLCRPVRIGYARGGLGATLTLLVSGPHAPQVQMQLEAIRARVNAAYGYNAIARIVLTQTAPHGFAEAQAAFAHAGSAPATDAPGARFGAAPASAARRDAARATAEGIADARLRSALETLALNVMTRNDRPKGP